MCGVLLLIVAAGGAPPAVANGIQVTINGPAGSTTLPLMTPTEIVANTDIASGSGYDGGMSVKLLAELDGVPPISGFFNDMTVQESPGAGIATFTQSDVASGFLSPPHAAVFSAEPYLDAVEFDQPVAAGGSPGKINYNAIPSVGGSPWLVGFDLTGSLLSVAAPTCAPSCGVTTGQSVTLVPNGVTLAGGPPPGPLMYSWDFGTGIPGAPNFGAGSTLTSPSLSASSAPQTYPAGSYEVRLVVTDGANPLDAGISPATVVTVVPPGQKPANPVSPVNPNYQQPAHVSAPVNPGKSPGTPGTATPGGGPAKALVNGPASGSANTPKVTVAPRHKGAVPSADAKSSPSSGSSLSGGGGGSGKGGSGGGSGGGGGAGRRGSGAAGARGLPGQGHGGSAASGASPAGGGAGRQKPPKTRGALGASAPQGLTGLLIESSGFASGGESASASSDPLSLLQSVARGSAGTGGSGGLPAWLLGIVSLIALVVLGIVRETGPGLTGRLRSGRFRAEVA